MEKGAAETTGTEAQDERDAGALLRYEEHVTGLLVTIVHLQGRLEHLQRRKAREETSSDLASESTASLPRWLALSASWTRSLPPLPPSEEGQADLFLDVQKAIASLENIVLSFRSRLPSAEAELEECGQRCQDPGDRLRKVHGGDSPVELERDPRVSRPGFLADERDGRRREVALGEERNAALRAELGAREEELSRSKASLSAYREERNKLQRKVKELQDALSRVSPDGGRELRGAKDPAGAVRHALRPPQVVPSTQPAGVISSPGPQKSLRQLRASLERLSWLNQLLSVTLQESRTDAEQLSLLLGRREADHSALLLAVQHSKRCLEAYELLLALTEREHDSNPEMDGAAPWAGGSSSPGPGRTQLPVEGASAARQMSQSRRGQAGPRPRTPEELRGAEEEARNRLRERVRRLRAEQRSLKLPALGLGPPSPETDSAAARLSAGIGARLAAAQEAIPSSAAQPAVEKAPLRQELLAARVALADLGTRLHLSAKEKQGLQLRVDALQAQEAAQLVTIRTLQQELGESRGAETPPSSGSSGSSSGERTSGARAPPGGVSKRRGPAGTENAGEGLAEAAPEALTLRLVASWARIRQWEDRLWALLAELEEKSQDCKSHEAQETELLRDFFKAHCNLLLAYQKARKKQEAQVGQLEAQVGLMRGRQARQVQALRQTLQQLEGRGRDGETP